MAESDAEETVDIIELKLKITKGDLKEVLMDYFDLDDTYWHILMRCKSGYQYGTVKVDDFEEIGEEEVDDVADYVWNKLFKNN